MQDLTPEGRQILEEVAGRHGVSLDAAVTLVRALALGNGTQAQFSHPDLGGMGQWSQGGMIMVGDMFNQGLKYRVDALCNELATLVRSQPLFADTRSNSQSQSQSQGRGGVSFFASASGSSGQWWPAELGAPASMGAQNDLRYAWFSGPRRLAIGQGGRVQVYDTGNHIITGFSQQQGGDQSMTFTSQFGVVSVSELPLVTGQDDHSEAVFSPGLVQTSATNIPSVAGSSADAVRQPLIPPAADRISPAPMPASADDVFAKIERLADLHAKGILSDEEFSAKKAELLSRI